MKTAGFNSIAIIATILFLFGEIALLFFTPRDETVQLFTVYFGMIAAYLVLYHEVKNIRTVAFLAVLFRSIAWLAFPNLSDDIYRFIWDGSIILDGVNPYLQTPTAFFAENLRAPFERIYPRLNSSGYYSVYPTVIQVASAFGALANNDFYLSALIIKLPILLAEIGTIWMLPKVLMLFRISPKYSVLYMLNPLIIVDVVGNGHFEAVMIFFILYALKAIKSGTYAKAGVSLAFAVATKLIPILLFPFLVKGINPRHRMKFTIAFVGANILLFLPVLNSTFFRHFTESLMLYFKSFEFNASIYYLIRYVGELIMGYNPISVIGPALLVLAILICIWIFIKQKEQDLNDALRSMLWALTVYFLCSTTVHPWYISTLIMLAIFSRIQYPIIWSALVFLSYSAYNSEAYQEQYIIIAIEYALLTIAILKPRLVRKIAVNTLRDL